MDFDLSKDQKEYRDDIIKFFKNELSFNNNSEEFSYDAWKKCADYGILGICAPEKYSGLNEGYLTALIAMVAIGYSCENNGFIFAITNHLWVCQNLISRYGTDAQKDKYMKDMIEGRKIGAFALTEASAGSDSFSIKTTAVRKGDKYVLNGSKMFISNGPIADVLVVLAVTDTERTTKNITAFIVEKDFKGFSIGKSIKKMGLNACPMSEIIFQDCEVPVENIIGGVGNGSNIINLSMEWERCFEFASNIGTMERIMEQCVAYGKQRKQFGREIISNQSISNKLADMKVAIEMSKLMLYKIGWLKDKNRRSFVESAIFKLYVSTNYVKTCLDALQIHGAYGYCKELPLEREVRDALSSTIYAGTSEIQRDIIFRMID